MFVYALALMIAPLVALAGPVPKAAAAIEKFESGRESLYRAEERFVRSTAAKGLDGFLEWFSDTAAVLPQRRPIVIGKEAIRRHYEPMFAVQGFRWEWAPLRAEVALSGDMGYTWGAYTVHTVDGNGQEQTRRGKYASVWRKQSDGEWRVVTSVDAEDVEEPQPKPVEPGRDDRPVVVV